jgi:hypothetical protein
MICFWKNLLTMVGNIVTFIVGTIILGITLGYLVVVIAFTLAVFIPVVLFLAFFGMCLRILGVTL